jgi:hypothetical protein
MRTREEHLAGCKERALEYLEKGDVKNAVTSMLSDLDKHPETALHNPTLALLGMSICVMDDRDGARRFIEGFN